MMLAKRCAPNANHQQTVQRFLPTLAQRSHATCIWVAAILSNFVCKSINRQEVNDDEVNTSRSFFMQREI